uniref:Contactin 2 n=1 Tax=Myotis myotis TaxID=51298 RepID=A0A7J7SPU2_MYOMY|nr:contactin 2 [Myotis myotis]
MEADIGSSLRWGCAAAGKPRPTVRWLRNGEPLASQTRVEVLAGDLRFSKLSLDDSGMYQCVAENKHGTIYASAELAVQGKGPREAGDTPGGHRWGARSRQAAFLNTQHTWQFSFVFHQFLSRTQGFKKGDEVACSLSGTI